MFRINDATTGNAISVNEIHEDGFNVTMDKYVTKNISSVKRDILGEYLSNVKDNSDFEGKVIPTGITSLDDALGGGLRNGLYVIGANPGMGKTSLMLHILTNLATNKQPSLFFNLDMSDIQTTLRLVANTSYRSEELESKTINDLSNSKKLTKGNTLDESIMEICRSYKKNIDPYINVLSIQLDALGKADNSVTYVESVETAIRNMKNLFNVSPVVVIDFLQMLQNKPTSTYKDEDDGDIVLKSYDKRIEMDKIIKQLKVYTAVYKVPIVVITSTNRSSYTKTDGYNNTDYDIGFSKESGNIEYNADVLIRLTTADSAITFGGPEQHRVNLNIVKSRSGKSYISIPLNFIPEYAFFSETKEGNQL